MVIDKNIIVCDILMHNETEPDEPARVVECRECDTLVRLAQRNQEIPWY